MSDAATVDAPEQVAAAAMLEDRGFDPTRVRLTGLRAAEWREEAACAGQVDRELDPWHDDDTMSRSDRSAARDLAREVCAACPVRVECLALGLALLPLGGVWGMYGGYTPAELRLIARSRGTADRRVAQHGTRARRVAGCDCDPCKRAHAQYLADLRAQERLKEPIPQACPATDSTGRPCQARLPVGRSACHIHASQASQVA